MRHIKKICKNSQKMSMEIVKHNQSVDQKTDRVSELVIKISY